MPEKFERGRRIRNDISLVLYLAGGWRSYAEISEEFGWKGCWNKSAHRNVRALEEAGLPLEWSVPPDQRGSFGVKRMRLPPDWVARTLWLRRYIILKEIKK